MCSDHLIIAPSQRCSPTASCEKGWIDLDCSCQIEEGVGRCQSWLGTTGHYQTASAIVMGKPKHSLLYTALSLSFPLPTIQRPY